MYRDRAIADHRLHQQSHNGARSPPGALFACVLAEHQQLRHRILQAHDYRLPLPIPIGPENTGWCNLYFGVEDGGGADGFHQMFYDSHAFIKSHFLQSKRNISCCRSFTTTRVQVGVFNTCVVSAYEDTSLLPPKYTSSFFFLKS